MNYRSAIQKAKQGIDARVYKTLRLVKIDPDSEYLVLIGFNKVGENFQQEAYDKLKHIELIIKQYKLEPGTYQIQCRSSHTRGGLVDSFDFIIPKKNLPVPEGAEDYTQQQEEMAGHEIDFDDYVKLIKENAALKALNEMLVVERDHYKKLAANPVALQDAAPVEPEKTGTDRLLDALGTLAPGLMALGEKFMEQRDRTISLEEQRLQKAIVKKKPAPRMRQQQQPVAEDNQELEQLVERLSALMNEDEDAFNDELDELEQNDPEMYQAVCEAMELEEHEEEEEE